MRRLLLPEGLLRIGACGLVALGVACSTSSVPPAAIAPPVVFSGLIGASEFVTGANRFPFGLVSRDGAFLERADVTVRFFALQGDEEAFLSEAQAIWRTVEGVTPHEHPGGELHLHLDFRGLYTVDEINFPSPGIWQAEFVVADGSPTRSVAFEVKKDGNAPQIGDLVPATRNPTIHEVQSFSELSSRAVETDDFHNVSVEQALTAGVPFVVFFASPQFCMSALCGPVTDTLEQAKLGLPDEVEFIHIEPWDLEVARDDGRLLPSPFMSAWGLQTEPWTFVVDGTGRVFSRFEGLVTVDEITRALQAL